MTEGSIPIKLLLKGSDDRMKGAFSLTLRAHVKLTLIAGATIRGRGADWNARAKRR